GVWLPGRGKKPFFPLCPCRTAGPTRPENSARLPPSRHAAYAPSGIIHLRSQHFASSLQDSCSNSLHAARFVVLAVYDTVVLVDGPRENTAAAEDSCTLARKNSDGDPTRCVAEIVNRLKGASSRIFRGEFPHLKSRLPTLWSRSYYAGTVDQVSEA